MATPRDSPAREMYHRSASYSDYMQPPTPRPSTAPSSYSSTTQNIFPMRFTDTRTPPPRPTSAKYEKGIVSNNRNPITGTEGPTRIPSGKKQVPNYFDTLRNASPPKRGKGRVAEIDTSRAGIPTFIQRIRIHEEDIYYKRPSTAPSPTTQTSYDSPLHPNPPPLDALPVSPVRAKKATDIPHLAQRRNPLLDNDDVKHKHRPMSKSNYESNHEVQEVQRKPNIAHAMHQTRPGFIPMDEPTPPPIKLRPFVPDDNEDVFYYRHAQGICPPDSTVLLQRQTEQKAQEGNLKQAQQERKVWLDDQIQQHKERLARWSARKAGTNVK